MVSFSNIKFPLVVFLAFLTKDAQGWTQCAAEDGGGSCPDRNTCCRTAVAGTSSCIPFNMLDPDNAWGQCCDGETGCPYGYLCATDQFGKPFCELQPDHPPYLYNDTSRYNLCSVPTTFHTLWGFPMSNGTFQAGYYSNMGDITNMTASLSQMIQVNTVIIVVHGIERNADDYFCTALSLLGNRSHTLKNTLVIVPWFASPDDVNETDTWLHWAENRTELQPLPYSWRYGADAVNAPISSYAVIDAMVEYLVRATVQFPKLRRIAVAGHSAGGQVTHRWALLSNSPVWNNPAITMVSVVANSRSFCYLDDRRFLENGTFQIPDTQTMEDCPNYNQWLWGLEAGGYLTCPYKDQALQQTPAKDMAQRYATRNVVYLAGELDVILPKDHCEMFVFQGSNRQERAKLYAESLQEYFGRKVHEFHVVEGSPHDHTLMLQSPEAMKAIFGQDAGI